METVHKKKSNNEKVMHDQTKGTKRRADSTTIKVSVDIQQASVSGVQVVASWRRFWRKIIAEAKDGTG